MIAIATWYDGTTTSTSPTRVDLYSDTSVTSTGIYYKDEDEPPIEFDEWAESFKKEIRELHDNRVFIMTKRIRRKNQRQNNKRLNHNSGLFWHINN